MIVWVEVSLGATEDSAKNEPNSNSTEYQALNYHQQVLY